MSIERLGFVRSLCLAFGAVCALLASATWYAWTHVDSISKTTADASQRLVPQLARAAASS